MTKQTLLIGASILSLYAGFVSARTLTGHYINDYARSGPVSILFPLSILICLIYIILKEKSKFWRIGAVAVSLAFFFKSCIAAFPSYAGAFAIATLILTIISIPALFISWRVESFDLKWLS